VEVGGAALADRRRCDAHGAAFVPRYRVRRADVRGFGESPKPPPGAAHPEDLRGLRAAPTVAAATLAILRTGARPRRSGGPGRVVATRSRLLVALGARPWATPLLLGGAVGVGGSVRLPGARGGRSTAADAPPEPPYAGAHRRHRRPPPVLPVAPTERRR